MILLPKELPELRDRMAVYMRDKGGFVVESMAAGRIAEGAGPEIAAADAAAFARALLLHIAPPMVDLLMQAKDGIGEAGFMDHDLPGPTGMAYLAQPIPVWESTRGSLRVALDKLPAERRPHADDEILAIDDLAWSEHLLVLWTYQPPDSTYVHGSVTLSWYMEREAWWEWARRVIDALEQREINMLRQPVHVLPPFVFDGRLVIGCHPDAAQIRIDRLDGGEEGHWRAPRANLFRALCYLLRQRVAESETVMPDRAARRRYAREGKEPPSVRAISIRGASAHEGGDGSREYVHRWIVRGHWRRQWYRSIQSHRPVWITPYVKGPDGAPLLGGEKVYTVSSGPHTADTS